MTGNGGGIDCRNYREGLLRLCGKDRCAKKSGQNKHRKLRNGSHSSQLEPSIFLENCDDQEIYIDGMDLGPDSKVS